jgi:RNA-binding protein YlmH
MPDSIDVTKLNDHELLLVLHTKFDVMREDMTEIRNGTAIKLAELDLKTAELEKNKASKVDLEKTDSRLDRVRTTQNHMIGGLILLNAVWIYLLTNTSK